MGSNSKNKKVEFLNYIIYKIQYVLKLNIKIKVLQFKGKYKKIFMEMIIRV